MVYKHIKGVKVTARFSKDRRYRYRLEITLQTKSAAGKTVCVVMQNPSYAGEEVADKSVQFMERVVFEKGMPEFCDARRLIVVNLFAHIQTNNFEGHADDIGIENDSEIKTALQEADIIIIAWGVGNRFIKRKEFVLGLLPEIKGKQLFETRMHPAGGRYVGFIQPFGVVKKKIDKELAADILNKLQPSKTVLEMMKNRKEVSADMVELALREFEKVQGMLDKR